MGAGKTFRRCAHFLLSEWLPDNEGVHYSNFPVDKRELARLAKQLHGIDELETYRRVQVIPAEELKRWRVPDKTRVVVDPETGKEVKEKYAEFGPWTYFCDGSDPDDDRPSLRGAHLAIDEAHLYIPHGDQTMLAARHAWRDFIAEIRHVGATVELLSQTMDSVDQGMLKRAAVTLSITNREDDRDPFFGITMKAWYELKGAWCGEWSPCVVELEKRKSGSGRWEKTRVVRCWLTKRLYGVYNSFSKPGGGSSDEDDASWRNAAKYRFERLGRVRVHLWFLRKFWPAFVTRGVLAVFCVWFFLGGGLPLGLKWFMSFTGSFIDDGQSAAVEIGQVEAVGQGASEPTAGRSEADSVRSVAVPRGGDGGRSNRDGDSGSRVQSDGDSVAADAYPLVEVRDDVAAVMSGAAILEVGGHVLEGETIVFGPWRGRVLEVVDFRNRRVLLDDGTVARLRKSTAERHRTFDAFRGVEGRAEVSRGNQVHETRAADGNGSGGRGVAAGEPVGGGIADGGVHPITDGRERAVGDLDGGTRRGAGELGSLGTTGVGSPPAGSTEARRVDLGGW